MHIGTVLRGNCFSDALVASASSFAFEISSDFPPSDSRKHCWVSEENTQRVSLNILICFDVRGVLDALQDRGMVNSHSAISTGDSISPNAPLFLDRQDSRVKNGNRS